MTQFCRALVGAVLSLAFVVPAHAATGLLSTRTALHEGPGNDYRIIGYVEPGRIPLGQCRRTIQAEDWCYIDREIDPGWIHIVLRDPPKRSRGAGGDTSTTADGTPGGDPGKGGGSRPGRGNSGSNGGNDGISPIDGASLPGSNGGDKKGDRLSWAEDEKRAEEKSKDPGRT